MDLPLSMRLAAGDRFIGDLQRCNQQGSELRRKKSCHGAANARGSVRRQVLKPMATLARCFIIGRYMAP